MAETRTITIHIAPELDEELSGIAESLGRDKASITYEALQEWIEDQEDLRLIKARIAEDNPTISFDEMMKRLDLED